MKPPDVAELITQLRDRAIAQTPAEFLADDRSQLRSPGLYSWWVDSGGAADLQIGLGQPVAPELIYVGLAGATRSRSGQKSTNTLAKRIGRMHLGGRHEFSTFRPSLGSILANARQEPEIDEDRLTSWMHEHLRVVTIPVEDADAMDKMESEILRRLDPPLNLSKVKKNELRDRIGELRRKYGRKTRSPEAQ